MRLLLALAILSYPLRGSADTPVVTVRGETIIVEDKAPPVRAPKPRKRYDRIAPPYSDEASTADVWARAWLVLDIDERGRVRRVKLLKKPGLDLEQIAIDRAFSMRFDPAQDASGAPIRVQLVTSIEWPAYWWLIAREGLATKIPAYASNVPCPGTGPMKMESIHPMYRDCSQPDLSKAASVPWIEPK
jgi:hypothetical protein